MASCSESQVKEVVEDEAGYQVVNAEIFKKMLAEEGIQIVDVRTAQEFSAGSIENAINVDVTSSDFATKIAELDKSKKTLIFCRSGARSRRAGNQMEGMGFGTVIDLSGGYMAWPYK